MARDATAKLIDAAPAADVTAARSAARLARVLEVVLSDLNLSLPQYRLLMFLSQGSSAASRLAQAMTVSRPSITALVDGVVAKGFVARSNDPDDRRRVDLDLTAKGRKALARADAAIARRLTELADRLDGDEAERALDGLGLWTRARDVEVSEKRDGAGA